MPTSKPKTVTVPAAEANRRFSELLRGVREEGTIFTITSHGRPVAQVAPAATGEEASADPRDEAWARIEERWSTQAAISVRLWTRDELYNRDPW